MTAPIAVEAAPVEVLAGQTLVIEVTVSAASEVQVATLELRLVEESGAPLAVDEVQLEAIDHEERFSVRIDENGTGRKERIRPGRYRVVLAAKDAPTPTAEPPSSETTPQPRVPEKLEPTLYFGNDSAAVATVKLTRNGRTVNAGEVMNGVIASADQAKDGAAPMLYCVGFASQVGSSVHNLNLSLKRAANAKERLQELGWPPQRVKALGYGELEGKGALSELNRRVEFWLHEPPDEWRYKKELNEVPTSMES